MQKLTVAQSSTIREFTAPSNPWNLPNAAMAGWIKLLVL